MANNNRHQNLEDQLRTRNEHLIDLYEAKSTDLPEDEEQSLLPILSSLENTETRYKEIELIAEGGEKRVTRVQDYHLNRQVAMARSIKARNRQDQEQFLREAQLEANLTHPNIVPVHNMGIDPEGVPFFTMELIPGDSFRTVIKQLREGNEEYIRRYPLSVLLNMFLKICDAIAYAHSRNVLHLDIKPDNIRVGEFGEVILCDWGLARIIHSKPDEKTSTTLDGDILNDMTQTGLLKGTPGFMAPEQTEIHAEKTFQTDIYALGVLLYNLLTYELPVSGDSANELIKNTRDGNIIPPHTRRKGVKVPKGLAAVALKAMALNSNDRYPSVIAFRAEITRYFSGLPTEAEGAGLTTRLSLLIKRHNQFAALLIFFLLLLAGVIGINMININQQKAKEIAARQQAEENFRLYRKQQEAAVKLGTQLTVSTEFALQSEDYSKAKEMIQALEIGLDKATDPKLRNKLYAKKGVLHFVLQQFNQAAECLNMANKLTSNDEDIRALSKKYAAMKPDDHRSLNTRKITDLIIEAKSSNKDIYYLYFHFMQRKPAQIPEEYLPLAKAVLDKINRINPDNSANKPLKLELRPEGYHLDLTDAPYLTFTLSGIGLHRISILSPLKLYSIDISNLPLLSLAEFKRIHIKELNMTGVKTSRSRMLVKQLNELGVEHIIMTTNDYPADIIEELQQMMKVIDSSSAQ